MMKHYTADRILAIVAGFAATLGALAILSHDALISGHWSLDHALMPVIVGITILAGHLIGNALRSFKVMSAAGFALLFVVGTGLTVYTSVGRQAKTADTELMALTAHNDEIVRLKSTADDLRKTLAYAEPDARAECKGAPDPLPVRGWPECKRKTASVETLRAGLLDAERKLGSIGAPVPVAPRADRAAEVIALFGYDKDKAKRAFILFEPFAFSLFLELTAIVAFGFGFRHRRKAKAVKVEIEHEPGPAIAAPPAPKTAERRAAVHSFVAAHMAKHGVAPTIPAVQTAHRSAFGVDLPKTTAWNWITEAKARIEPVRKLRVVG